MWFTMYFFQIMRFKKNTSFDLKVLLWLSISDKNLGVIKFSEPQQFSESENFGPLGTGGGGVHGDVSWPIDYCQNDVQFNSILNSHTEPLFKFLKIFNIEDVYKYRLLILYYNLQHTSISYYIYTILPNIPSASNRIVRNVNCNTPPPLPHKRTNE